MIKILLSLYFSACCSSGTRIKTRKRNIAAPLDPAAFADAVVQIYLDNAGDLVSVCVCVCVKYMSTFFGSRKCLCVCEVYEYIFDLSGTYC